MNEQSAEARSGFLRTPGWNLALATVAFALCFTAWSLIAPFAKTFKEDLGLSYTEALFLTATPRRKPTAIRAQ